MAWDLIFMVLVDINHSDIVIIIKEQ